MWDPVWEDIFATREWGKYPSEDLIRFVARNFYQVPDRSEVRLLEVGCGPGANLWYLAREGFSFAGIDGSQTAIDKAASRLDGECPGWRARGDLRIGDIASLPYESLTFDAVIDNEALSCNGFEAARDMYAEIARVLKPGGRLYSRTFAIGSWGDGSGESLGRGAWRCAEGPLAGKGVCRFTAEADIPELLAPFELDTLEVQSWTCDNRHQQIREWLITAFRN
jgi:SAM-dependent methyltransferase